jgi:hypothetical protein
MESVLQASYIPYFGFVCSSSAQWQRGWQRGNGNVASGKEKFVQIIYQSVIE